MRHLPTRTRRLRHNATLRNLVARNTVTPGDLVLPLFIKQGHNIKQPIKSMPGIYQYSIDRLEEKITDITKAGITSIMLFGIPTHKDTKGSDSLQADGIIQQALRHIKSIAPDLYIMTDICLCEYTENGHCGLMNDHTGAVDLDNDATLPLLQEQALSHAQAGADLLSPSGMVDGVVAALRETLDQNGYAHIPLLPHTIKYALSLIHI